MAKRKRGAQPGNLNALKHGFYSKFMHQGELDDLDRISAGLDSEINALRVLFRRILIDSNETDTYERYVHSLNALGLAATRIASLMRIQKILTGEVQSTTDALTQAVDKIAIELRLK